MAKIVEGIAMVVGAIVLAVVAPELLITDAMFYMLEATAAAVAEFGVSLTMSGVAAALQAGPSEPYSIRQPTAYRKVIYGQSRVSGVIVYNSTTNNGHDLNMVIAWAGHPVQSVDTIYVDGRAIHVPAGGGNDDGNTYTDDSGNTYSFGSDVAAYNSVGSRAGNWFSDLGGRDSNWNSSCTLNGIAATYIRFHFNSNKFSGPPGVRGNLHGRNEVYDPRTGTTGYSNNAALVIADFLCNSEWGLGCVYANEIDEPQLIAAANLCDEQVALAAGGTESRYTINGSFDTSSPPGDTLDAMLVACEGRLSFTGGRFRIFPAAFWGSGLTFYAAHMAGPVRWTPYRKRRDLVNTVRGTYISPKYPYAQIGYDQDHKNSAVWSGQWQPTDFPEYAQDVNHGYVSDANLAADGTKLYTDRSYRFVTSVGQAQRLAKIFLLRNRFQGSGTLQMQLPAFQCTAQDVIQVTFPGMNWLSKYLEVQTFRFVPKLEEQSDGGSPVPVLYCELDVIETDPSVYLWSTAEERGIQNTASPTLYNTFTVNPPTSLTLQSSVTTAVVGADGVTIPRIDVTWIEPDDPFVLSGGYVELQWQKNGATTWNSAGYFNASISEYFITGVVTGQQYNVQVRAVRKNGASSIWMGAGPHTVSSGATSISLSNVAGAGALAGMNYVDFASGVGMINKTAANLAYSNGLSVDSLRPAQANADQTAGKSLDILADGTVYVRVKSSEATGGIITGKSYGINLIPNWGFENALSGGAAGDDWTIHFDEPAATSVFSAYRETGFVPNTGSSNLVIRVLPNITVPSGTLGCRVQSGFIPVTGGTPLFFGGYHRWDQNIGIPANLNVYQRIGILCYDVNKNGIGEVVAGVNDIVNTPNSAWSLISFASFGLPKAAAYIVFECAGFTNCSSAVAVGNGDCADMRFDDVFCVAQLTSSGMLNYQGSIMPNQLVTINYTTTKNSIAFSWPAQSILRGDGSTFALSGGSYTFSSLSSSTAYYTYWFIDTFTGTLQFTNPNPPPTGASAQMAALAALDGRIPAALITATTLASTNSGTGGGTGGGAGICPEAAELVTVENRGQIAAGEIAVGDRVLGKSFKTGTDVYRRVLQLRYETCVCWRIVEGHKVSPCEPVFVNGEWMPAFRASSQVDTSRGRKVHLSVESDEYNEQNYYLAAGTPLLIHNAQQLNPC